MRIVFLNPSGELGGAETALLDMLAALTEARPTWDLELIASADGPLLARAGELGIRSVALKFPQPLARLGEWGGRDSAIARPDSAPAASSARTPPPRDLRKWVRIGVLPRGQADARCVRAARTLRR